MTVTPYRYRLFHSRRDLYQFLADCQQESIEKNQVKLVSISLQIPCLDPLAVLHQINPTHQLSCYFEKRDFNAGSRLGFNGMRMAAIGSVAQIQVSGADRFCRAQNFIQSILDQIMVVGEQQHPDAGPHFFASFTFFDQSTEKTSGFPATTVFLPQWQISRTDDQSVLVANLAIAPTSHLESLIDEFWRTWQAIRNIRYSLPTFTIAGQSIQPDTSQLSSDEFQRSVARAIHTIQSGTLDKVVLAQTIDLEAPLPFQLTYSLNNLRQFYPDCYIFAIHNGQGQSFIGASPERLVSLRNHELMTDALAGSAPRGRSTYEDAHLANTLLHNPKELHEHQVVIEFITEQLHQLGLTPHLAPLRLLQLSNIQHLHTPIRATVPSHVPLLDIVAALHPTPAVAGMPRAIACEQIRQFERFDRGLYAAPIGWIDHQGNGEFAVGIRSALINGCHARLYAGAGIVAGSDPARELAEVQLKLQALSAALV